MKIQAFAKVNLTLEVVGRRADGYHELVSIFATAALADDVHVSREKRLNVIIRPDVGAPEGDDLSSRAVRAYAAAVGREPVARIRIRKRIPVAAGLGGGSSDAAATLRGLAAIWRTEAPGIETACAVGSDVPFFLSRAPFALVEGRGERVQPLPNPAIPIWLALVLPVVKLLTAPVFATLRPEEYGDGIASASLAESFREGTVTPGVLRAAARNDLLAAAERSCDWIAQARALGKNKGLELHLSGTGPTLFAVADDRGDALRSARLLKKVGLKARAVSLGF